MRASAESTIANSLDITGDGDFSHCGIGKSFSRYSLESSTDSDGLEVGAARESIVSHCFGAVRDVYRTERSTALESLIIDGLDLIADHDGLHLGAVLESLPADGGDVVGLTVVGNGGGNGDIAAVAETVVTCGYRH